MVAQKTAGKYLTIKQGLENIPLEFSLKEKEAREE